MIAGGWISVAVVCSLCTANLADASKTGVSFVMQLVSDVIYGFSEKYGIDYDKVRCKLKLKARSDSPLSPSLHYTITCNSVAGT